MLYPLVVNAFPNDHTPSVRSSVGVMQHVSGYIHILGAHIRPDTRR
jgi:hypothetical protein